MRIRILTAGAVTSALLLACMATAEPPPGMPATETPGGKARATFAVHCYDVGAGALNGKPGVVSVQRGFSGAREVDRVVYDPQAVSVMQLEAWLKAADTYIGTLENTLGPETKKEMTP